MNILRPDIIKQPKHLVSSGVIAALMLAGFNIGQRMDPNFDEWMKSYTVYPAQRLINLLRYPAVCIDTSVNWDQTNEISGGKTTKVRVAINRRNGSEIVMEASSPNSLIYLARDGSRKTYDLGIPAPLDGKNEVVLFHNGDRYVAECVVNDQN